MIPPELLLLLLPPSVEAGNDAPKPVPPALIVGNCWARVIWDLRLLFEDALGRNADVEVVDERLADQLLKLGLLVDGGPLLIADGALGVADDSGFIGLREMWEARGRRDACSSVLPCSRRWLQEEGRRP